MARRRNTDRRRQPRSGSIPRDHVPLVTNSKSQSFLAGRRSATAPLAQMQVCDLNVAIDLRGLRQIPAPAADQSCAATSSANALIGVGRRHPALPSANPHSARGATAYHFPRFRSLKAFGRRPRCKPHRRDRPASETLDVHSKSQSSSPAVDPPRRRSHKCKFAISTWPSIFVA